MRFLSICVVLLASFSSGSNAQSCPLVADLFGGLPRGSKPAAERSFNGGVSNFSAGAIRLGGAWLFVGENEPEGRELRSTDGTVAGTRLVRDIKPGPGWSSPMHLVQCGSRVFFSADDGVHGRELWVTDGTAAGTTLVRDIAVGTAGSLPEQMVCLAQTVFFRASRPAEGDELWRSDGTASGTRLVADLRRGGSGSGIENLFADPGTNQLFFCADDGVHGAELWVSRGTAATTGMVVDLATGAGGSAPGPIRKVGSSVVFSASRAAEGRELWRSDGTAPGTQLVADIWPGPSGGGPNLRDAGQLGGLLYFGARDGRTGIELWRTDGTTAGTTQVADIDPGPGHGSPFGFHAVGSGFYLAASTQALGSELYWCDGTAVRLVADLFPGVPGSGPRDFFTSGSQTFFAASDGRGRELWVTDHQTGSTGFVRDIHRQGSSNPEFLADLGGGRVLLRADEGQVNGIGDELFVSDGTTAGTVPFLDLHPGSLGTQSSAPRNARSVDGRTVLFGAYRLDLGVELYQTDEAGRTALVKDLRPGPDSSNPEGFTSVFDGRTQRTVFWAESAGAGREPFVTDGTGSGTFMLKDISPGFLGNAAFPFVPMGNLAYFPAGDRSAEGQELWVTDGTPGGTRQVGDLYPGPIGSHPHGLVVAGRRLFFVAYSASAGRELWTSDGTAGGTRMVRDLWPGPTASEIVDLTVVGDRVVFQASTPATGRELFLSDGTAAGTVLLRDMVPGGASSHPYRITALPGRIVFFVPSGFHFDLWVSDLTTAGTVPLGIRFAQPFPPTPAPLPILACGDLAYFGAIGPGTAGEELWITDGTAAGTRIVADLNPGTGSSSPHQFVCGGGGVFFAANGQLYASAGTAGSTGPVCDPVPAVVSPSSLVIARGVLYFAADGSHGREWYRAAGTPGSVEVLGTDCGAVTSQLACSDPRLGTTLRLRGRGSAAPGLLVLAAPAVPFALPSGLASSRCIVWEDLSTSVLLAQPGGPAWSMGIPIPNQTSLIGLRLAAQSVYDPLPWSLSNGLLLTMGR